MSTHSDSQKSLNKSTPQPQNQSLKVSTAEPTTDDALPPEPTTDDVLPPRYQPPLKTYDYTLAIVGGGASGIAAAHFASTGLRNVKVVVIEDRHLGGDSTWAGCIPSKALMRCAGRIWGSRSGWAELAGGEPGGPLGNSDFLIADPIKVNSYVQGKIQTLAIIDEEHVDKTEVVYGKASFVNAHVLKIVSDEGQVAETERMRKQADILGGKKQSESLLGSGLGSGSGACDGGVNAGDKSGDKKSGDTKTITFISTKYVLLALGASPTRPTNSQIANIENVRYLTTRTLFLPEVLKKIGHKPTVKPTSKVHVEAKFFPSKFRLCIVGAGPIGCGMAQSFARLGYTKVTLIGRRLIPSESARCARVLEKVFIENGVEFILGNVVGVEKLEKMERNVGGGEAEGGGKENQESQSEKEKSEKEKSDFFEPLRIKVETRSDKRGGDISQSHSASDINNIAKNTTTEGQNTTTMSLDCDCLLVVTGRTPNTDPEALQLRNAGIGIDPRTHLLKVHANLACANVPVDTSGSGTSGSGVTSGSGQAAPQYLEYTENYAANVFAAGDCISTRDHQFAHFAAVCGFYAVRNIFLPGNEYPLTSNPVPRCIFTMPEVASVGISAKETREKGGVVWEEQCSNMDRGICENEEKGFFQVCTSASGHIIGATFVCERAGDLIGEITLAMSRRMKFKDLRYSKVIRPYPSYGFSLGILASVCAAREFEEGMVGRAQRWMGGV